MGKNSGIEWTDHTFNPWWGCVKVSPACENCYAETFSSRIGQKVWGPRSPRRFFDQKHWDEPRKWSDQAARAGRRARVFCASMADVFESRRDLDPQRERLWQLILETPNLDWLLLTKRPQNASLMMPPGWYRDPLPNVWIGTTVEDQKRADLRIPDLLRIPARIRFLSCEPLLGYVDLRPWISEISWVIAGGESGACARPTHPAWFRQVRDQCGAAGVAFHFKQWGEWAPFPLLQERTQIVDPTDHEYAGVWPDGSTGPGVASERGGYAVEMLRIGKRTAGRKLDGLLWEELPEVSA